MLESQNGDAIAIGVSIPRRYGKYLGDVPAHQDHPFCMATSPHSFGYQEVEIQTSKLSDLHLDNHCKLCTTNML